MNILKNHWLHAFLVAGAVALTGCEEQVEDPIQDDFGGPAQEQDEGIFDRTERDVERTGEETRQDMDRAGEEAQQEMERTGEELRRTGEEAEQEMERGAEETERRLQE